MPKQTGKTKKAAPKSAQPHPDAEETKPAHDGVSPPAHMLTINVPLDEAFEVAAVPVKMAGRMLSARGGLPLYSGLAVLAAAQVIEWPVAAAAGIGYAVLRRWGPLRPPHADGRLADGRLAGERLADGCVADGRTAG